MVSGAREPWWRNPHVRADVTWDRWGSRTTVTTALPFPHTVPVVGHGTDVALGHICSGRFEFRLVAGDETTTFLYAHIWFHWHVNHRSRGKGQKVWGSYEWGQRNFFLKKKASVLHRLSTIPHPPWKPLLTTGSTLTTGGIKRLLRAAVPHLLLAQLSRTSAMRPLLLALLGICFLTEFIVEGKSEGSVWERNWYAGGWACIWGVTQVLTRVNGSPQGKPLTSHVQNGNDNFEFRGLYRFWRWTELAYNPGSYFS